MSPWMLLVGAGLAACMVGCETTSVTTLEESRGFYRDAREFIMPGTTTRDDVLRKYGKPSTEGILDGDRTVWRYTRREMVAIDAYSRGGMVGREYGMAEQAAFRHSVPQLLILDVYFRPDGVVYDYRVRREGGGLPRRTP